MVVEFRNKGSLIASLLSQLFKQTEFITSLYHKNRFSINVIGHNNNNNNDNDYSSSDNNKNSHINNCLDNNSNDKCKLNSNVNNFNNNHADSSNSKNKSNNNNNNDNNNNNILKTMVFTSSNKIYNVKQIYNWLKYSAGALYLHRSPTSTTMSEAP